MKEQNKIVEFSASVALSSFYLFAAVACLRAAVELIFWVF